MSNYLISSWRLEKFYEFFFQKIDDKTEWK